MARLPFSIPCLAKALSNDFDKSFASFLVSFIEYFKNGQDWGDGGIQEVVDKIYRISKREDILNNFVKEAIAKIKMKKDFNSNKSLPPITN